jgi:hypothetical protein
LDEPVSSNPHGPYEYTGAGNALNGSIADHTGYMTTQISAFYQTEAGIPAAANYSFLNNIILPNAQGHASWWLTLTDYLTAGQTITVEHNTAMLDAPTAWSQPMAGVITRHTTTAQTPAGMLASYRSNLLWNPSPSNQAYKTYAYGDTPQDLNPCLPTACDYNNGWNMLTDGGGFSNGGNGYADNFSSVPGQHDLSVNPMFVDATRNMATFDTAYLHNTATAWSSGATYSVGNMVSSSDPTLYATTAMGFPSTGAVINYRYTNGSYVGTPCSGANPKPGLYTAASRACWEWATLYDIRQAVAAGTLYDDQTIGAHGVDIIMTLIQWVRAGYSPANSLLAGSAHDGTDIGAVPVSFLAPSAPNSATSGATMRGGKVVKGGIR